MFFFSASVPHVLVITRSYLYIDRWFTARGTKAQVSFTDPSVILAVLWPHFHWKNHDQDQEIIKPTRAEWFRRGRYPKVWYFGLTQRILAEQTRVRQNQLSSCKVGKFFFFPGGTFFCGTDVLEYLWCFRMTFVLLVCQDFRRVWWTRPSQKPNSKLQTRSHRERGTGKWAPGADMVHKIGRCKDGYIGSRFFSTFGYMSYSCPCKLCNTAGSYES